MTRKGRSWIHSGRITKAVDRQRWWTVFREHTTTCTHYELSRTSSVLTPSTYPRFSLSLALRSFGFLLNSTPTGLTPHSHVHSGSLVSASLPQRGLRLLRRNRFNLQLFVLHNTDTISFPRKKTNPWLLGRCLWSFFFKTVEGRRDRWVG